MSTKKIPLPTYDLFKVRLWKNAFEMCCQEVENEEGISGWCELYKKNLECLKLARNLVETRDKKLARKIYNNPPKESLKFLASLIANDVEFEIEDRTHIVL